MRWQLKGRKLKIYRFNWEGSVLSNVLVKG